MQITNTDYIKEEIYKISQNLDIKTQELSCLSSTLQHASDG